MHPVPDRSTPLWAFPCFDDAAVRVAVSGRDGGVSTGHFASLNLALHVGDRDDDVRENRSRAAKAFGAALTDMVFCEQVAGSNVTRVDSGMRGRGAFSRTDALPATDALITTDPAVTLVIMVADCMPIVLHDDAAGVLAVVHAGWPGTVKGIIPAAVSAMITTGAQADRLVAAIGPAVSADIYQVGDDVAEAVQKRFGNRTPGVLPPDGTGRYLFNLPAAATWQLTDAGLSSSNVHLPGAVTGPHTPFFSHRLEQPTGRFAVFAQLAHQGES